MYVTNMLWKTVMLRIHTHTRTHANALWKQYRVRNTHSKASPHTSSIKCLTVNTHNLAHAEQWGICSGESKTNRFVVMSRLTARQQLTGSYITITVAGVVQASDSWGQQQDHVSVGVFSVGQSDSKDDVEIGGSEKARHPWLAMMKWLRFDEEFNLLAESHRNTFRCYFTSKSKEKNKQEIIFCLKKKKPIFRTIYIFIILKHFYLKITITSMFYFWVYCRSQYFQ